jgi:hypothetical protein
MNDELSKEEWKQLAEHYQEVNKRFELEIKQYEASFNLLYEDEAFIGTHWDTGPFTECDKDGKILKMTGKTHPCFCLLMNDTFELSSGEGEEVPQERWIEVNEIYKKYGWYGLVAWVALRRGYEPLKEIAENAEYSKARAEITIKQ